MCNIAKLLKHDPTQEDAEFLRVYNLLPPVRHVETILELFSRQLLSCSARAWSSTRSRLNPCTVTGTLSKSINRIFLAHEVCVCILQKGVRSLLLLMSSFCREVGLGIGNDRIFCFDPLRQLIVFVHNPLLPSCAGLGELMESKVVVVSIPFKHPVQHRRPQALRVSVQAMGVRSVGIRFILVSVPFILALAEQSSVIDDDHPFQESVGRLLVHRDVGKSTFIEGQYHFGYELHWAGLGSMRWTHKRGAAATIEALERICVQLGPC